MDKTDLRVLFILPEFYPHSGGGISTYYLQYIKALQPFCKFIKVIVGSGYIQSNDSFTVDGITVDYLKPEIYHQYLPKFSKYDLYPDFKHDIAAAWAMWHQANLSDDFDMVECTDFSLGFIPWVVNRTKPVITRLHGSAGQIRLHENALPTDIEASIYQQAELLLLPKCDKLISHSMANLQFWNNLFEENSVTLSYPAFDKSTTPLPLSKRHDHGLVTARIQNWKGPVALCEAYKILKVKPLIKWYGRDTLYNARQSTSAYLKVNYPNVWGKYIIPLSAVPNTEMNEIQQSAKFGLIPSTWDMFNFTVAEFMAAGTPVICSDGAGASELIEHGKNGYLYPATDTNALAQCIDMMQNLDETAYSAMSAAAVRAIHSKLSPGNIIPGNLLVYENALKNFTPSVANSYISTSYAPSDNEYLIDSVLDKQPLKKLTRYYLKRIRTKIVGK